MTLDERRQTLCDESRWDFSDLRALFLNCTLERSPERSHTEGLMRISPARGLRISTRAPEARRTTSRTATRPS